MHAYLPTLKQLQYFVALHDHKHFGKAAEACFVTQSTLSAGLRELENLLGIILVERTRRVVRFTAQGDAMVAKAVRILREAEELVAMAVAAGKPLTGELRMAVIPTIAPFLLPHILPLLRAERPELKLYLREENSRAACDSLHRGTVDCVLLALPYACGDVDTAILFDDALHLAFPTTSSYSLPDRISVETLIPDQLLLLEDGHCLKDHALSACNRPELRSGASMMGTSLHTLVQMVDNGLGITMLPQMAISAGLIANTRIATRPLVSEHAARSIALVWRKNSPREAEFRLLAKILQAQHEQDTAPRKMGSAVAIPIDKTIAVSA
jgi:LysR family transcriptional regulator, hydrogen peroxide-inducible genes activator